MVQKHNGTKDGDLSKQSLTIEADLLICCAGGNSIEGRRPPGDNCTDMSMEDVSRMFFNNVFTAINVCSNSKIRNGGLIVLVGSAIVGRPRKGGETGIYASAKAALHEYTLHLNQQLANVRVNCIAPDGLDKEAIARTILELWESPTNGQVIRIEK